MDDERRILGRLSIGCLVVVLLAAVIALLREPRAAGLAMVTLQLVAPTVAISLVMGTILAVFVARTDLPLRGGFIFAWCLLLFLPLYVQASAWDAGFGQQGWFTIYAGQTVAPWLAGMRATIWIHSLAAIPWVMLIVGQGLRQVEAELEEVALLDAAPLAVVWNVTLPRAWPAIISAAIFVAVLTAGDMTVTDIYRVRTYAEELYTNAALTTDAVELGMSIWPHIAIVSVLAALAWQGALAYAPINMRSAPTNRVVFHLESWRWPVFVLVAAVSLLAVGLPVANLVYKAGLIYDASGGTFAPTWSWQRFAISTLPEDANPLVWRFFKEYKATLMLAGSVAGAASLLGIVAAMLTRADNKSETTIISLLALGLAIPGPLAGIGVIWLLNHPEPSLLPWLYDETFVAPTLTILLRALPITTLVLWSALRSVDQDQVDAARADGASWLQVLLGVMLPQRWPALLVGWLVAFAIAAGDLASSLLVIPPGQTTIANQVFLLVHAGVHNAEAGLCLGQTAFFGVIAAAVLWLLRKDS